MGEIKTYRDLIVWQKSMSFVTNIYKLTNEFPKGEMYALTSQIRRSAVSIPSNIAEGYGRNSKPEYVRFLKIAIASLFELQTQLQVAVNLEYFSRESFEEFFELSREIERMLSSLIRKLK
ncbi:MAG: four helix bundle protein [Ignavibacteria bacterium RBG_13_36_8]|nr:MAG: four helix bundle protein [Ignavibacteria bacterium RBG_13_36_8]